MADRLKAAWLFVCDVYREFVADRGTLFAAAISFFGLISFIPLILLATGVFGYIFSRLHADADAFQRVLWFIQDYIPIGTSILEESLESLIQQTHVLSLIGFLGLLWTGTQVFVIIQQVMNIALGSKQCVGFLRARLVAVILVMVAWMLFLLSIGITSVLAAIRAFDGSLFGIALHRLSGLWTFIGVLVPMLVSTIAFAFIYKFSPTQNVGTKGPIIGGVTAAMLFEIAKQLFRWYVTRFANFGRIYGSLESIVVLVIWIYYVSLIAVIGAEVASVYARREGRTAAAGR